jgi:transposase
MADNRRKWPREVKLRILAQVHAGRSVAEVARENDLAPVQVYSWQRQLGKYGDQAFQGNGHTYTYEARMADLERKIGQLTMENDLLKKAHARLMNRELEPRRNGGKR